MRIRMHNAGALAAGLLLSHLALGAEIQSLRWESAAGGPAQLVIQTDQDIAYDMRTKDDGRVLRIEFPHAVVGPDAAALPAREPFAGATVEATADGTIVQVTATAAGRFDVVPIRHGYQVTLAAAAADGAIAGSTTGGATLHGIEFSPLPGGRVQILLKTDGAPPDPDRFVTETPPRIALDFAGMRSALDQDQINVKSGAVDEVDAVTTAGRTRVVIKLIRSAPYTLERLPEGLAIVVDKPAAPLAAASSAAFAASASDVTHHIDKVDFHRTAQGGGRISVSLSDPAANFDMHEQDGKIIVEFPDTGIAAGLERRLDVVDFATPVQYIDTHSQSDRVRLVVIPTGHYQQSAYLAGSQFTLDVSPVKQDEAAKPKNKSGYTGQKLSLNFQSIDVRAALQVLADFTNLNFVTSDTVKGNLTLRLEDVPWDQALDIILETRGLAMRRKGNVIWVAPVGEIAAKERLALESQQKVAELEPLASELIQVNYANAEDIAKILKSVKAVDTGIKQSLFGSVNVTDVKTDENTLLSPRGNVTVDTRTNTILIQDTPDKIRQVRKLVAELDRPVRQVMVETRIVEANDNFTRELGARLGFQQVVTDARIPGTSSNIGDVTVSGTLEGASKPSDNNDEELFQVNGDGLQVDLPALSIGSDRPGSLAAHIFKVGSGYINLISLELSALEAEGEGKIIAQPRLVTSNQQEARIEQGQERIFTTTVNQIGTATPTTKKAVLSLTVKPQITPDDNVILTVEVTKDSFTDGRNDTLDTKRLNTEVQLANGETVVIGGIYQQEHSQGVTKVPVLGDIPVLGALFRKKSSRSARTELLIFLTPKIISPSVGLK